jgi:hypothetical protein
MMAEPPAGCVNEPLTSTPNARIAPTCRQHGVKQEDPSVCDVLRQLVVEELRLGRLLVPLDEDLANPHRPAALPQALLHGLASPHDGHAADLALEYQAIVGAPNGGRDCVLNGGEVVEALFHQQTDDPVGVEDEVSALGLLVTDDPGA